MLRICWNVSICIILILKTTKSQYKLKGEDLESALKILNLTSDIIKDTERRTGIIKAVKKKYSDSAPFEIGYLTYDIQEKYRRMVDKYNVSVFMRPKLYLAEMVLYLEEIERHFWEIQHISNMMHEIERKYAVEGDLKKEYKEEEIQSETVDGAGATIPARYVNPTTKKKKKPPKFKYDRYHIIWKHKIFGPDHQRTNVGYKIKIIKLPAKPSRRYIVFTRDRTCGQSDAGRGQLHENEAVPPYVRNSEG